MASPKRVFVAFAIEDVFQRDALKGQTYLGNCPYEYIDLSVKEAYESDWQTKVQTRIRGSHGVIVLASKNSPASTGQKWEIDCAKAERKPILGIQAYNDDYTAVPGVTVVPWTRQAIADFIDRL